MLGRLIAYKKSEHPTSIELLSKKPIGQFSKSKLGTQLTRRRWLVMFLLGLTALTIEAIEHYRAGGAFVSVHFISEILFFAVIIPTLGVFLLGLLARSETERDLVVQNFNQHLIFGKELITTPIWEDLVTKAIELPKSIVPIENICLRVYNRKKAQFETVAFWSADPDTSLQVAPQFCVEDCSNCSRASTNNLDPLSSILEKKESFTPGDSQKYCLPLAYGGSVIATLHFSVPGGVTVSKDQAHAMISLAPELAIAIDRARLQTSNTKRAEAIMAERRRIATELHDNLGQNISFLRLKLDQLTNEDTLQGIAAIRKDLVYMNNIANEAYVQVRGTLDALHASSQVNFSEAMRIQSEAVAERTNLKVVLTNQGQPCELPPHVQHQVLYICREALNNIEKHANAQLVEIDLIWGEYDLTVKIVDDGQGFDPHAVNYDGHYGLTIMQERVEEINGQLKITSDLSKGTILTLKLPI